MLYKRRVFLTLLFALVTVVRGQRCEDQDRSENLTYRRPQETRPWLSSRSMDPSFERAAVRLRTNTRWPVNAPRPRSLSRVPSCSESRSFDWIEKQIPKQVRDYIVVTANTSHRV